MCMADKIYSLFYFTLSSFALFNVVRQGFPSRCDTRVIPSLYLMHNLLPLLGPLSLSLQNKRVKPHQHILESSSSFYTR